MVQYSLAIEITNKSGKSIYKPDAQEFKGQLTLGGTSKPALSVYEIPLSTTDMAPGEYVFTITGTDLLAKASEKIEYAFEVLPTRLGFIQPGIHIPVGEKTLMPSPWSVPVGQNVVVGFAVVGFELGPKSETDLKKRQPDLRLEMRVVDEATGKDTLSKPKYDGITEVRDEFKLVIPFTPLLEMNRPGRFKIQLKVTDNHSKQTAELALDVTVFEIK